MHWNWGNIWGMSSFSFVHPKKIEKWIVEKGVIVPYHHFISSLVRLSHSSWSVFCIFILFTFFRGFLAYMYNTTDFQVACPFHPVIFYSPFTAKNGMPSAIVSSSVHKRYGELLIIMANGIPYFATTLHIVVTCT